MEAVGQERQEGCQAQGQDHGTDTTGTSNTERKETEESLFENQSNFCNDLFSFHVSIDKL